MGLIVTGTIKFKEYNRNNRWWHGNKRVKSWEFPEGIIVKTKSIIGSGLVHMHDTVTLYVQSLHTLYVCKKSCVEDCLEVFVSVVEQFRHLYFNLQALHVDHNVSICSRVYWWQSVQWETKVVYFANNMTEPLDHTLRVHHSSGGSNFTSACVQLVNSLANFSSDSTITSVHMSSKIELYHILDYQGAVLESGVTVATMCWLAITSIVTGHHISNACYYITLGERWWGRIRGSSEVVTKREQNITTDKTLT